MKALDKDRARRYESPNQLAADVQRHLSGEAVVAAPPTMGYRVRKFVKRNRGKVIAGSAVAAALLVGIAGTMYGLQQAHRSNKDMRDTLAFITENVASLWQQQGALDGVPVSITNDHPSGPIGFRYHSSSEAAGSKPIFEPLDGMGPNELAKGLVYDLYIHAFERYRDLQKSNAALTAQTGAAEWSAYTANLALAQSALAAHNYPEARRILDQTPESRRGWEYRLLRASANAVQVAIPGDFQQAWLCGTALCVVERASGNMRAYQLATGEETSVAMPPDLAKTDQDARVGIGWKRPIDDMTALRLRLRQSATWRSSSDYSYEFSHNHSTISAVRGDEVVFLDATTGQPHLRTDGLGTYLYGAAMSDDRSVFVVFSSMGEGGLSDHRITLGLAPAVGGPAREVHEHTTLVTASILDLASTKSPPRFTLTTPDRTRIISGSADRTVRFFDAAKPEREIAVFRQPDAVTNLQMTGDGTRLIISLADGSARVWDIRDPEERRADLQREWAERVPAGEYLDGLWERPADKLPTDKIRDAIINDATLTPLRRLVAVEMLDEKTADRDDAVREAFETITKDQTDPTAVQSAAKAADLPARVKEVVIAKAAAWEYKKPEREEK